MITIVNTNPEHGDPIELTADTLEQAVADLQESIRACGPDFEDVEITDDDYEIVEGE